MNISKIEWDEYFETIRDLVALEREHADTEERIRAARKAVAAFEKRGVRYEPTGNVISFDPKVTGKGVETTGRRFCTSVRAEDLF